MTTVQALYLGIVTLLLCIGQILFKIAAEQVDKQEGLAVLVLSMVTWPMLIALSIYGAATCLWVYLLSEVPLSRAYPFFSLAFVLVPVFGWWFFDESIGPNYVVGVMLIVAGLYFTVK